MPFLIIGIVITLVMGIYILQLLWQEHKNPGKPEEPAISLEQEQIRKLHKDIEQLPTKVLETITSSTNNYKGKLGELIGYISLNAEYDKLIALRDITDFIGIKFTKGDEPGTIDFIDIKNGDSARLTKDQNKLRKIIEEKRIRFITVKVDTDVEDTSKSN